MNTRLRDYIESVFEDAPKTKRAIELKEEILQNLTEKYDDLIKEGETDEAAFNIAVASMGDISSLIEECRFIGDDRISSKETYEKDKQRSALLISISVMLYILCVIPVILIQNEVGLVIMFLLIAAATGLIIYNGMMKSKYVKMDDTMVEEFRAWKAVNSTKNKTFKTISSAMWTLITALYLLISFITSAWHITWIIFLIGAAIEGIIKAILDLKN